MSSSNKVTLAKLCKRHYHVLPIANHILRCLLFRCLLSRCLLSVFTTLSTRKAKQSIACGLLLLAGALTTPVSAQTVNICGRTHQVEAAILAAISPRPACHAVTSAQLAAITGTLGLYSMSIFALQVDDFAGLTSLTNLNLNSNNLTTIEANTFSGLTSLTTLSLNGNNLTTIEANTFSGLTSLTELNLFFNDLTTIKANTFSALTSLTELDLGGNLLTTIEANAFSGLTSLTRLDLHGNPLTTIEANTFSALTSLTELDLGRNNLTTIEANAFSALTSLTFLSLFDNDLTTIEANTFSALTSLTFLNLFDNNLTTIEANTFSTLTSLTELSLRGNDLTTIEANTFSTLTSLTRLFLTSNALTTIEANAFSGLTSLNELYLTSNALTTIEANAFSALTSLTFLSLFDNDLTTIEANTFSGLSSLTTLNLGGNLLTTIEANTFSTLTSLTFLSLFKNALTTLPTGLFDSLTSLTTLYLSANPFITPLPTDIFDPISSASIWIDLSPIGDLTGVALTTGGTTTINIANAFISRGSTGNDRTLSYTLTPANTAVATATESGGVVTITGRGMGTTTVSVTANDGSRTRTRDIAVTVVRTGILAFDEATGDTLATPVVAEDGGTDTLYVQFASAPANDVTLTLISNDTNEGTVTPATLTFTAMNWNARQALTVTAVPDNVVSDDTFTVDFMITTGDGVNYPTSLTLPSVTVTITDDDTAGLALFDATTGNTEISAITTGEDGTPDSFYVALTSEPTADVTVTVTSTDTTEGQVTSGASLTFTNTNWNDRQQVTVTGQNDNDFDGDIDYSVTLSSTSSDTNYNALTDTTVSATNTDDDTAVNICSRTNQVEEAILNAISLTSPPACDAVTAAQLAAITFLNLYGEGITTLQSGDFAGLTGLTTLSLIGNNLTTIDANAFSGLTSLTGLFLDGNDLTTIEANTFSTLTSLTELDLRFNNLTTIDANTFSGLTSLTALVLSSNALTTIEANTFSTLTSLTELDLRFNNLTTIEANLFSGLTSLIQLFLHDNALTTLKANAFSGLTSLTFLNLHDNALTTIEAGAFSGLTGLTELNLIFNPLTTLKADTFSGLTSLITLVLSSNDLTTIDVNAFSGLTSLTTLFLNRNDLTTIDVNAFSGLTSLTTLFLDGNDLTTIEANTFSGLTSLTTLFLDGNDLTTIDANLFSGLTSLIQLFLHDNALTTIEANTFSGLTSLISLGLGFNPITTPLPADIFDPISSASIWIDLSPIGDLTDVALTTGGTTTINIANAFISRDVFGNDRTLSYTLTPANTAIATVSESSGVVTIEGVAAGTTDVTITAADGVGTATQTISVTVIDVGISVHDAMTLGNEISATTIAEASGTDTLYVQFASAPANDVTLTLISNDTNEGTVTPATLTFTAMNWNARQALTVTAVPDNVVSDDTFTVDFMITTGDGVNYTNSLMLPSVTVTVTDDDTAGITLFDMATGTDAPSITTSEDGTPDSFYVALTSEPTADVTVTVTSTDTTEGQVTSGASLTFTNTNWNDRQQVTVTGQNDNDFDGDIDYSVTLSSTSSDTNYNALTDTTVIATNTDDDTVVNICSRTNQVEAAILTAISSTSPPACDAVTAAQLAAITGTMNLNHRGITSLQSGDFSGLTSLTDLNLTFNRVTTIEANTFSGLTSLITLDLGGNNLSTIETGTFSGLTSLTTLDLRFSDLTTIDANAFSGLTSLTTLFLNRNDLTTIDVNAFSGLTSLTTLNLVNNALTTIEANTFSGLTSLINLRLHNNDLTTIDANLFSGLTSLTQLFLDGNDLTTALPANLFADLPSDAVIRIDLSPIGDLTDVALTTGGTTTINIANAFISRDVFGNDRTLSYTLTPANTAIATVSESSGVVTIEGVAAGTTDVTITAADGVGTATQTISVTVIDVGISVHDAMTLGNEISATTIAEASGTDTLYVQFASAPANDVTLTLISNDTNEGTVTPATLTFTAMNWNARQALTVTAVPDNVVSDDTFTVDFMITTGDGVNYTNSLMLPSVTVTVTDDDTAGITLFDMATGTDAPSITTSEDGTPDSFYVALTSEPTADVTVTVTSTDTTEGQVTSGASLTFTNTNWNDRQQVTVTGQNDNDFDGDIDYSVTLSSTSSDTNYNALTDTTVIATNTDDDTVVNICSRTNQVEAAILTAISSTSPPACDAVTAAQLAAITGTMNLNHRGITSLQSGDFSGLTGLTTLSLTSNRVTTIEANTFSGLTSLITLDLGGNNLSTIETGTFSGLTSLTTLDLRFSDLTTIDANAFSGLTSLTTLFLNRNDLTTIDVNAFSGLTSLTTLNLVNNALTTIEANTFSGLTSLINLRLHNNDLTTIDANLFSGLTSLTQLFLDGNDLTTALPANLFADLPSDAVIRIDLSPIGDLTDVALTTGGTTTINIANAFISRDVFGNDRTLSYTLTPANTAIATVSESSGVVTIEGVAAGTTDVTITAADGVGTATQTISVTVIDVGISVHDAMTLGNEISATTIAEASGTDTLYVQLASAPANDVTLTLISNDTNEGTVTPATLTFTAMNWNARQALTVTAVPDNVVSDDTFTVDFMITTGDGVNYTNSLMLPSVTVTVTDDDTAGITLFDMATGTDAPSITTSEDGTPDSFYVALTSEPTADVTVTVTSTDTTEGQVTSGASLTFTNTNWNDRQQVTVTGQNDNDFDGDIDYSVTLSSTSSDTNYNALTDTTVIATNTDDDTVVNICSRTNQVEAAILTAISSTSPPACDAVTAAQLAAITFLDLVGSITTLQSGDFAGLTSLTQLNLNNNSLTTIEANTFSGLTSLTFLNLRNNALTTIDANTFSGLTSLIALLLAGNNLSTIEANAFSGLTSLTRLELRFNPITTPLPANLFADLPSNVSIRIDLSPIGDLTGVALTTGGTTTINIANAFISRGSTGNDRTLSYTLTPANTAVATATESGGVVTITGRGMGTTTVSVTANDGSRTRTRDIAVTVVRTGILAFDEATGDTLATPVVAEDGGTDTLYVQFASAPANDVTLTLISNDTNEGTVTPATLTFTAMNWNARQALTVTAVPDNVVSDDTFTVDFMITTGDGVNYTNSLMLPSVTVTVTDDDTAGITLFDMATGTDAPSITTSEDGTPDSFYVALTSEPTGTVTVTISGLDAGEHTSVPPSTLTFTPTGDTAWNTRQVITLTGVDDTVVDGNQTYDIALSPTGGGYDSVTAQTVSVTNTDTDTVALTIADLTVNENAGMARVTVTLTPAVTAGDVTVDGTTADGTATAGEDYTAIASQTLTFTGGSTSETLDITISDDSIAEGDETFTVMLSGLVAPTGVTIATDDTATVTITDDETVLDTINLRVSPLTVAETALDTITLSVTPSTIAETAGATTITVTATIDGTAVLPTATDVMVTISGGTATVTTDYTATPSTLTITIPAEAASATQTFMITPVDDGTDDNNETVTITGTAGGFTVNTATLTIVEAGILVFEATTGGTSITTATIADEASGTDTLHVQLASQPAGNVTLSVISSDTNEGTVTPATLTFTTSDWNTRQALTVTAVDDNVDRDGDTFMVDFAVTGGDGVNYTNSLDLPSVTVTITDDDMPSTTIDLSISPDSIQETAGETTITVTATLGGAAFAITETLVTLTISGTATITTDYTLTTPISTITIAALATSATKTFMIDPVDDTTTEGDETVEISGTAPGFTITSATLTITEFSEQDQEAIEQTVAAQASGITQVVTEQIGIRLASRTSASSTQDRQSLSSIDWQDRLAKFTYEGLKHLDSEADMSLDWLLRAAGGNGQLLMPLGARSLTLWATGGRISTKGDGVADYEGDVNSLILGIDTALANDWLAGIAISYNDSEVDYTMDGTPESKTEQTLYGFHPYLSRTVSKGLTLWGTAGYGFGDIDFSRTMEGQATSDITQWMAAGGLEQQIITNTPWQGALRIKGLWGNAEVDAATYDRRGTPATAKFNTDFWRAHMESEMGYNFSLPGGSLRPYAIIGGRWDHNDAIVSGDEWHVDVGGGVEVIRPAFTLNISVRTQVTEGDTEEDSIFATGSLTYDLEQDGRGLQIALSRPLNNASPSWDSHSFNALNDTESSLSAAPLTSELAYGWTVRPFGLEGALQTYVQNSFDSDDRHYAVGLELAVNALTLNFETGYHDHTSLNSGETGNTGLESMFKTKIRW